MVLRSAGEVEQRGAVIWSSGGGFLLLLGGAAMAVVLIPFPR